MSHWSELKPRKRILPFGRWRVLTRLWLAESKRRRTVRNEQRLRTMEMMREVKRMRVLRHYR